jgi:hypothetical protein
MLVFRFYSYGLEKKFKPEMYTEFEAMTLKVSKRRCCTHALVRSVMEGHLMEAAL